MTTRRTYWEEITWWTLEPRGLRSPGQANLFHLRFGCGVQIERMQGRIRPLPKGDVLRQNCVRSLGKSRSVESKPFLFSRHVETEIASTNYYSI
jgi:hypothetical protein